MHRARPVLRVVRRLQSQRQLPSRVFSARVLSQESVQPWQVSRFHHSVLTQCATRSHILDYRSQEHNTSQNFSNKSFFSRPYHSQKRIVISGRLNSGIEKRRTVSRSFCSKGGTAQTSHISSSAAVTWRDALKSPAKAVRYMGKLRTDIVDWAKHMWAGVKLLAADVRVSARILRRITNGKQISRRERNFMVQTGVDLARLVPFSLFLIIPLAEFALPFALKLFPSMLPSQFQDQMKKEEDLKRQLKGRIEIAKYLRDVVEEKAKVIKASSDDSELKKDAEELTNFLEAIRSGSEIDSGEVSKFARLFSDELTIDGAVRPQLVAMCKYMGISPYGHDHFLRFKLRSRLNAIKRDDMEIMWEGGAESLTDEEVVKACRDRGIRTVGISKKRLRRQLNDWLDLSQRKEIPGSLMIMSRAFFYTGADGLKETLGSLPDDVIMDVKQAADIGEGSNQERLEEARRQAKLIEMESEAERRKEKEDEEKRKKKEEEESARLEKEEVAVETEATAHPEELISDKEVLARTEAQEAKLATEIFGEPVPSTVPPVETSEKEEKPVEVQPERDQQPEISPASAVVSEPTAHDEEERHKEIDDIERLIVSLGELASESAVEKEREELKSLKQELAEAESVVRESGKSDGSELKRLKSVVRKLEREIEKVDTVVGLRMKLLDKDNDGMMSMEECTNVMHLIAGDRDDAIVKETLSRLDADADGNISKADLARLLRELQSESSGVEGSTVAPAQSPPTQSPPASVAEKA